MGLLREYIWKGEYRYYDTPEGQDCAKKIFYVTKYAGIYGIGLATLDVVAYSHPQGLGRTLGRYAYIAFPVMGMGAAFTAATCAATNIRKKDDPWNYSFGALAATSICAAWQKSWRVAIFGGLVSSLIAAASKDAIDHNVRIFPDENHKRMHINPWTLQQDWTIMKDPGRTWKTGNE